MFNFLEKTNIKEKEKLLEYLKKNEVYLTHSMEKQFSELAFEYENSCSDSFYDIVTNIKMNGKITNKQRGMELLEKLEESKMPLYYKTMKKIQEILKKTESKLVSIKVPRDLEGKEITLEIKLAAQKDVGKLTEELKAGRENLELLMNIFENGIWEE